MPTKSEPSVAALSRLLLLLGFAPLFAAASGPAVIVDSSRSRVEISVKSTVDSFVAQLSDYDAIITVSSPTGPVESAIFRARFTSIKTGKADRDRDMNEWQQTAKFSEVVFTLDALETAARGGYVARGKLRFHGVERLVSFPLSIERKNPAITIEGEAAVDTRDFGLSVIKKFLVLKVDPVVHVHFHLQGKIAGPP